MLSAVAAGLWCAPAAFADATESANWAGYAVHHRDVRFIKVLGSWTQPRVTCSAGTATYSAVWIGIGGYNTSSRALEQIGTEDDCAASGRTVSSAWYELVPSASHAVALAVHPGDRMRASVSVIGHAVTLTLRDLTRHRLFTKQVRATTVDASSAEWIVEAPSACSARFGCQTLPLADFGSTRLRSARATTSLGTTGAIENRGWTTTKIGLARGGRRFLSMGRPGAGAVMIAAPSALTAAGTAFTVTYEGSSTGAAPVTAARAVAARRLVHPGGART